MFTREELAMANYAFENPDDTVAKAKLQLLAAEAMARGERRFNDLVELGNELEVLAKALLDNKACDIPQTLTNLVRGFLAQVRVAIAVAQQEGR